MKKWQLWLAASIGIVVIVAMMVREFDWAALRLVDLSPGFFLGVAGAALCFVLQNAMLILRFHHLVHCRISLQACFRVNALCEFTSAVTPSAVGGSGLAFIYLNREGVSMGRSIFTMFAALMADEAFLGVSCLLLYLLVPSDLLFSLGSGHDVAAEWISGGVQVIFLGSTLIVAVWALTLYFLLLHRPEAFGWVLKLCCRIPWLHRFRSKAEKFGQDMTVASAEARQEGLHFWVRLMGYTAVAWLSRFAIVLAILLAFRAHGEMLLAWARQWVIWMIAILTPTPGGSGVAELMFRIYYSDFLPDTSLAILAAMLWRMVSYYPYLVMGAVALPKWIKKED